MKRLLLIPLLCLTVLAAGRVVNGRIHISINNLTGQQALTLKSKVASYYLANELGSWPGWQNVEWQVETNVTEQGTRYDVNAVLAFASSNVAERVYSNLVNRTTIPTNVTGAISIHYCLLDPTNTTGWRGCNIEPEANYREMILNQ